jgi:autotransporter-associated beta strand protein
MCLALRAADAGSATWNLNPASGDWNTAANWMPNTVPNAPGDEAAFDISNITEITLSADTEVSDIRFDPDSSPYTITVGPASLTLTVSGTGITNDSGIAQNFVTANDDMAHAGTIAFLNRAGAGEGTFTNEGAQTPILGRSKTQFFDRTSAQGATFINNGGQIDGPPGSPALGGLTQFLDNATAGEATFINNGGVISVANGGATEFLNEASAGRGTFIMNPGFKNGGQANFLDNASADHGNFIVNGSPINQQGGGYVFMARSSTAGKGTFTINGGSNGGLGGLVNLLEDTTGGTARFIISGNGQLSLLGHNPPGVSVSSIEGDGGVTLWNNQLTVTSDTRNTVFSGRIKDGFDTIIGSFAKAGAARVTLSGANTYKGNTTVSEGTLLVSNPSGSGTGTGAVQVNGGTLGGSGTISGPVTVGTGSGTGASLAPAGATNKPVILRIKSALTLQSDAIFVWSFKATSGVPRADQVKAAGVTIDNASFAFGTVSGTLSVGTVLTVISNTTANPINGAFSNLADGAIVNVNGNNLRVSYTGGDGNDLTLTVVP